MEFKGTQGEWYNPKYETEIISMPSQIKIGRAYQVSMDPKQEDMQANAKLMATAPELLEALQSAITFVKHNVPQPPIVQQQVAKWERIVEKALNI